MFVTPVGSLPTPQANVGVSVGPSNARAPSLAVDATGLLHLVETDDASGSSGVYYARSSDGASWSVPMRIDGVSPFAYAPRIAVEREPVPIRGRVYAVFESDPGTGAQTLITTSDNGITWTMPARVDTAPVSAATASPAVAASEGRAYLVWSDGRDGTTYQVFLRASGDGGATWGGERQLSGGGISNLQARIEAKANAVVVVWREASPTATTILSARSPDGGTSWTFSTISTGASASENLQDPELFVDELGVAHVAWVHQLATGETHVLYASSSDGMAWSVPVRVDDMTVGALARSPSIFGLVDSLWVAWADQRTGDFDVYAAWSTDGVAWGDGLLNNNDLRVDDTRRNGFPMDDATNQLAPVLRTGSFGVFVAWEDYRSTTNWDVYYSGVAVSPLVITELQDEPAGATRVEIYNLARTPFSLAGVTLDTGASIIPLDTLGAAPPRAHLVVGAPSSGADLEAPISLGSEGARVVIRRAGEVLAAVGSGPFGIAPDPLPGEATARFAGTLDYTAGWTRAPASSFGARNGVPALDPAPRVVLNEVLFNPSAPGERFVELYARGPGNLDLAGYRIVGDGVYTFPSLIVGPASPHAALLEGRSPAWFGPLDATGDNVYLYDPAGRLLDMVGWTGPHGTGMTVARTTEGAGGTRAYDEATAAANGWAFDQSASLALVDLEADGQVQADIGTTVQFVLRATNLQTGSEILNVGATSARPGWTVRLLSLSGAPLPDSPGDADAAPDLGSVGPGATADFIVEIGVPGEGLVGDANVITVSASAASLPVARDFVDLEVDVYPHFDLTRTVAPAVVYQQGSGAPWNEVARVTVRVQGAGFPIVEVRPQDVVFQIDVSGSMAWNDPGNVRTEAVKAYIDNMRFDDRGSLIGFNDIAWVVANRPLTFTDPAGKTILKADADTLAFANGGTNIDAALQLGNDWLITYGNGSNALVEILLTDGRCTTGTPPCPNTNAIINQAISEGIAIFTISLGADIDEPFLRNIADRTGGQYYHADTPQDLLQIYSEIGTRVNRTAGIDPDPFDSTPMVEDDVAPYLTVDPASFTDPLTGLPRPPSSIQQFGDRTRLQWNVERIDINETWAVQYDVTSARLGIQDVALYPDARVAYMRWDESSVFQSIPQGTLEVLRAPTPPYITATTPADGATNVPLSQSIGVVFSEGMDASTAVWTLAPSVGLTPTWPTAQVLTLTHAGLSECTEYTVEIMSARDTQGESLIPGPVPNPWRFNTICPTYVRYTITRIPANGDVLVDGNPYRAPAAFVWQAGEVHAIAALDFDPSGPSRFAFRDWDDGGARNHGITVGVVDLTITARYTLQHPVVLSFVGLPPNRLADVRYTVFDTPSLGSSATSWAGWVDDDSSVDVDRVLAGIPGERFITLDPTDWTVREPLDATLSYYHQFTANLTFAGLELHPVPVEFTALGGPDEAGATVAWDSWVDAGSEVRVPDTLAVADRERYQTLDATVWTAEAPLVESILYRHQFRPHILLQGLDENHTVGATWRLDGGARASVGLTLELFAWADAGSAMVFDRQSTGSPARTARDPTVFPSLDEPVDATIRYAAPATLPPPNWKPFLAVVYTLGLLAAGAAYSRRSLDHYVPPARRDPRVRASWDRLSVGQKFAQLSLAEIEDKVHRDRRMTRTVLIVPFAAVEGTIGLLSHLTGLFRIPDAGQWLPLGFWVNTSLLLGGLFVGGLISRKGYRMTDDALLRLAEARERDAARRAP